MAIELPNDFKEFLKLLNSYEVGNPPIRIEILTSISGVEFSECYTQRVSDLIDNVQVNLIDLTHLKQNKQAAGRYKDLDDLDNLP